MNKLLQNDRLIQAAESLVKIDDAGAMPDFLETLAAAKRQWAREEYPPDREWRYRHGCDLADLLAEILGASKHDALVAIKTINGDHWPALATEELFRYSAALQELRGAA